MNEFSLVSRIIVSLIDNFQNKKLKLILIKVLDEISQLEHDERCNCGIIFGEKK